MERESPTFFDSAASLRAWLIADSARWLRVASLSGNGMTRGKH